MNATDILEHNRKAWNIAVDEQNIWTRPVGAEQIAESRQGKYQIVLTPQKPVPKSWLGDVKGKSILALAAGGGQQASILAAAGAKVTLVDISEKQLARDQELARTFGLDITTLQTDAADLGSLANDAFDLIINPVSNCFFPSLPPVWQHCARVLKKGGSILTGFNNPVSYCFDFEQANLGTFILKYPSPYADHLSLDETEFRRFIRQETPIEFGHSLSEQIGGLIACGLVIDGFYEDFRGFNNPMDCYFPQFIALRASKPS